MNRTADEAMYDMIVSPLIPYKAPISWDKLEEGQYDRIQAKEICSFCFAPIIPFSESFTMDAGHGGIFEVTGKSGLCRACFDALRANPPNHKPFPRVKINYSCGSVDLQTIEDIVE